MTDPNWTLVRKMNRLAERARIIAKIRAFFTERNYLEVETPHRIPANAPEVHIDPIASEDRVLHTSPEIAMKRMLAAGYDRIFQLCRVWRNGERGQYHLPEFTMLEWYQAGADYHTLMNECEELFQSLLPAAILYRGEAEIELKAPWPRLTVVEAFSQHATVSLDEALATGRFEEILTTDVEPHLGKDRPTFLIEYPSSLAALARTKPGFPNVAERFELYISGIELANAFSELSDPDEQRQRFEQEEAARRAVNKPSYRLPEKFLEELDNMPEAAGIALGIDRLVMMITGAAKIDEVVAFSTEDL